MVLKTEKHVCPTAKCLLSRVNAGAAEEGEREKNDLKTTGAISSAVLLFPLT